MSEKLNILKSLWWSYLPVALVGVIGVLTTVAAFIQSLGWEKRQVEIAFNEAAQDRILMIQREFSYSLGIVQDIASFIEASEALGRREFRKFVGPALKNQAGIKILEWVPVIHGTERSDFIQEARKSFPPYRITEIASSGELIKGRNRSIYYPVLYVQPYQSNKEVLGLDLGTDQLASALLEKAVATGSMQVSSGVSIIGDNAQKTGIMVVVPVFDKNKPAEAELHKEVFKVRGFAIGVFYVGSIVERAMENLRAGGVDLEFYKGKSRKSENLLYTHFSRSRLHKAGDNVVQNDLFSYTEMIPVGTEKWKVISSPAPGKFKVDTLNSWILLSGGIAFTALLTIYLATLVGRERRVRLEVQVRTSQLEEANQALNREVLERKSAEEELHSLNESLEQHVSHRTAEAERKAQYLEQFAYVTSHDLKAPLRAVSNLAEWIEEDLDEKLDDVSREQLALLRDRVHRMHDLIEGLLEYSRVGGSTSSESYVDVRELLVEIIDSLSPPDGFSIKIKGDMPTIYVDRLQLGQIFSNLISNSLKHHGGRKGKIRIRSNNLGDNYEFSVCDNGQGIAPEYHDKIFLMFQSLESSDFENSTGIGLALVKKIVEEHGGTIRVESAEKEGACFYFTWPNKRIS